MRLRNFVAVSALLVLPVAAYLFGRNSPPPTAARVEQKEPATTARESSASVTVPAAAAPRRPFIELYCSFEKSTYSTKAGRVRELCNIGDLRQRRAAISSVFKCLAMINTGEALALLSELDNDADRMKAVDAIVKGAPGPATATLVQHLTKMEGAVGEYFRAKQLPTQIAFWSALDPAAAAQFVDEHPDLADKISETSLLANWAAVDPDAATRWLQNHPDFVANAAALNDYVYGLYDNDPEVARQYVADNAADPRFAKFVAPVAARTFHGSPEAAETFVRGLADGELRQRALAAIAATDLKLLAGGIVTTPHEYERVADWMRKFPAEERDNGLKFVFVTWANKESGEAVQWLGGVPAQDQQAMIDAFAQAGAPIAWPQFLSTANPQLRERFLTSIARTWDGTAAEVEGLARDSGLAPQDVASLKRLVGERKP